MSSIIIFNGPLFSCQQLENILSSLQHSFHSDKAEELSGLPKSWVLAFFSPSRWSEIGKWEQIRITKPAERISTLEKNTSRRQRQHSSTAHVTPHTDYLVYSKGTFRAIGSWKCNCKHQATCSKSSSTQQRWPVSRNFLYSSCPKMY